MTAVKENLLALMPEMPTLIPNLTEDGAELIYNLFITVKQPRESAADDMVEFEEKMDRSQQWAKDHGLTPDDITKAIKAVRQRKRQNA